MLSDRMSAVLALLGGDGRADRSAGLFAAAAAAAAAKALGVDGVSAGVGTGPQGVVLARGREKVSVALDDAQFTLGQGPGLDAVAAGTSVLVSDLADAASRWPGFVPAAQDLGVHAIFVFPLRIGAIIAGVLTAHRASPGPLAGGQLADALALADAVTVLLLHREPPDPAAARPSGACRGRAGRSRPRIAPRCTRPPG